MANIIGNRYKLVKLIGKGGMADVYLALDTILNREVAIKILKDEMSQDKIALERFAREAKASAYLVHSNIVEIYDIGDDGDKHYIVMEYIKGYTLKKLIDVRGAIPVKESVWLMKQLALALLEAHKNGIIHRDVKSQNVLIKDDGTIKMADFGIAQAVNDIQITHQNTVLGSVHYLAPELTKGKNASMQSDIYSLGIVFYELLTGDVPFKGDSAVSIALQHVNNKIPSVRQFNPDIPQAVENIIIKATAKNTKNRYDNVALMIRDLNQCLNIEHANDQKVVFDDKSEKSDISDIIKTDKQKAKERKKLFNKKLPIIGITAISLLAVFAIIAVLFLSGKIGKANISKTVIVPDLSNKTVVEAGDILDDFFLEIDYSNIERVMTDNIEEGLIISCDPSFGSEVDKGTKLLLKVSSGQWAKMDNFIGLTIDQAKEKLIGSYFTYSFKPVKSNSPVDTIVSQSIQEGENYNPNIANELIFEYSENKSILIDSELVNELKGKAISDVETYFTEKGFKVQLTEKDYNYFQDSELNEYPPLTCIRIIPDEGSTFVQEEDNYIEIYYYKGE